MTNQPSPTRPPTGFPGNDIVGLVPSAGFVLFARQVVTAIRLRDLVRIERSALPEIVPTADSDGTRSGSC